MLHGSNNSHQTGSCDTSCSGKESSLRPNSVRLLFSGARISPQIFWSSASTFTKYSGVRLSLSLFLRLAGDDATRWPSTADGVLACTCQQTVLLDLQAQCLLHNPLHVLRHLIVALCLTLRAQRDAAMAQGWQVHVVRRLLPRASCELVFIHVKCSTSECRFVGILSSIFSWKLLLVTRSASHDSFRVTNRDSCIESCSASTVMGTVCCAAAEVEFCSLSVNTFVISSTLTPGTTSVLCRVEVLSLNHSCISLGEHRIVGHQTIIVHIAHGQSCRYPRTVAWSKTHGCPCSMCVSMRAFFF